MNRKMRGGPGKRSPVLYSDSVMSQNDVACFKLFFDEDFSVVQD